MSDKILIAGPSWVGDMVMAQSLLMTLKQQRPGCEIDVLAPGWSLPIMARMPEANGLIEMPTAHGEIALSARYRLGKSLRAKQYDQAIVLTRSLKSALVPFFAKVPRRTGYLGEQRYGLLNDIRPFDKTVLLRTVERFVNLGRAEHLDGAVPECPNPTLMVDNENVALLRQQHDIPEKSPIVALMPGAEFGPAKQWPLSYFAELAAQLAAAGITCLVLGSAKEAEAAESIRNGIPGILNLCGKTQLADAVDLLAMSDYAVTNDSGLMHVCAAVGTPLLALYGSTTPIMTPPLADNAEVLERQLDCRPCGERECPLIHHNCLREISADEVSGRVLSALKITT